MGRAYERGLAREWLNSAFMRLKGYTVEDNPQIRPTDGLNSVKCPDHRINGTVYDSYAPKVSIRDWNKFINLVEPENEFELMERSLSDMPEFMHEEWRNMQRNHICKGIGEKVSSGQTRNILLNLSDTPGHPKLLSDNKLPEAFKRIKNLERVICIQPKSESPFRGETSGKGETWTDYLECDMEAVQWTAGSSSFSSLPDGGGSGGGNGNSGGGSGGGNGNSGGGGGGGGAAVTGGLGVGGLGAGGGGSFLGMILSGLGILAGIGAIAGLLSLIFSPRDSSKSPSTKASKTAVSTYRRQMPKIIFGKRIKPDSLPRAHDDLKDAVIKMVPPSTLGYSSAKEELDALLDAEYRKLVKQKKFYDFFDSDFVSQLLAACALFIFLASRLVDTLVALATVGDSPHGHILGTHVGVMAFCWLGQRLLQLAFLSFLSGPLKLLLGTCVVSMVIWVVYKATGYLDHVVSGTTYVCHVLWNKTEEYHVEGAKPKRVATAMATITLLQGLSRALKSLSLIGVIFKFPSQVFTPLVVVVKLSGWVEVLGKVAWAVSVLMVVLLVVMALEMALPQGDGGVAQRIGKCAGMRFRGVSVHSLLDALWQDAEKFIDSKPRE